MLIKYSECLKKDWNAPIHSFFHPVPTIDYDKGCRFHEFACAAKGCQKRVCHYLDKGDAKLTSNLQKHAKQCWGVETVEAANNMKDASKAHCSVIRSGHPNGSITALFERTGKGKVTFSHWQHTKMETKFVHASRH
ncbi:hypothetical protein L208DRAFT_1284618 [Tricholoma matsutake]|nr:hypothetical protein L208DRAFT_1284618 [Tricholoma matsutake 945]